jgi:transposase
MLHKIREEEKNSIHYNRFHHPHPRVQLRMEVLWLYSLGKSKREIAVLANVSENTVRKYIKDYLEGGIEKLKEINFYQPKSQLENYQDSIEKYFQKNPPMSWKEAGAKIEELTGIKRSEIQVGKFLKKLGFRKLKIGYVPGKADLEEQKKYQEEKLKPRLEEAKRGERAVFFVDAAHFVMQPFLGWIWCLSRIFIKSPSGRKRFNVLGALNAITKQVITVENNSYITAIQVKELIEKTIALGLEIPITFVLDNARYQKCKLIKEEAEKYQIELLYLPPYSPNLNLIERLWKLVKKKCLYGKYYEDFNKFSSSISKFIKNVHTENKEEVESLLTLRFQTFDNTQIMSL